MTDIVERLEASLNDPMWADHAEISKAALKSTIEEIRRLRKELDCVRQGCAAIARQMNAPSVAGAIEGDGK